MNLVACVVVVVVAKKRSLLWLWLWYLSLMSLSTMVVLASWCPLSPFHSAHLARSRRSVVLFSFRFSLASVPSNLLIYANQPKGKTMAKHTQSWVTGSMLVSFLHAWNQKASSQPRQESAMRVRQRPPSNLPYQAVVATEVQRSAAIDVSVSLNRKHLPQVRPGTTSGSPSVRPHTSKYHNLCGSALYPALSPD